MKIIIDMGHSVTNPGCSSYLDEVTESRAIGRELISLLENNSQQVVDISSNGGCTPEQELDEKWAVMTTTKADLFLSIHFKEGEMLGTKTMCRWHDRGGQWAAMLICDKVHSCLSTVPAVTAAPIGRPYNYPTFVEYPMVVLEVCSVSEPEDVKAYWNTSPKAIATAIYEAIKEFEEGAYAR